MKNIFVEGVPGSGKTTLIKQLAELLPEYNVCYEGDASPVELAWCACMTKAQYQEAKARYPQYAQAMDAKAQAWEEYIVLPYTKIEGADGSFCADMEQYEIYGGRRSAEEFRSIVLKRFETFKATGNLLDCSFFQNIMDELLLFQCCTVREVVDFYREILARCDMDALRVVRLVPRDLAASLKFVRAERVDDDGMPVWAQGVTQYMAASPYGKAHDIRKFDDVIEYYAHRTEVEKAVFAIMPAGTYMDVISREYAAVVLKALLTI